MDPADLERLLDRELKQLRTPRAPATLLPRVLAATVHREAPAPRGWQTWPMAWRVASIAAASVAVLALWFLAPWSSPRVSAVAEGAGQAATIARVFSDVFLQPIATYLLILAIALCLACAAVWTAFELALGGVSHR
jgi:hypothetical protein